MRDDLIRRSDAIKIMACEMYAEAQSQGYEVNSIEDFMPEAKAWLNDAPSIEQKTKVIAQVTFDEDKLREIAHEAVERIKEEYDIVDRPKGEWIDTNDPLRLDDEWACSRCGNISFARTNFCDRCGARMKGADDEV